MVRKEEKKNNGNYSTMQIIRGCWQRRTRSNKSVGIAGSVKAEASQSKRRENRIYGMNYVSDKDYYAHIGLLYFIGHGNVESEVEPASDSMV